MMSETTSIDPKDIEVRDANKIKQRKTYISIRVKEIQQDLKSLSEERQNVVDTLKSVTDQKAPETKALKDRRSYLAHRPVELRAELTSLQAERRELSPPKPAKTEE